MAEEYGMDRHGLDGKTGSFFASRANIAPIAFLAIDGFLLATERRAHLIGPRRIAAAFGLSAAPRLYAWVRRYRQL